MSNRFPSDLLQRRDLSGGCRVIDREHGVVDYLISTENLCGDGLRLKVGRWDTKRFQTNPVMPWSHAYGPVDGYDGRPVGVMRGIRKDRKGEMFGRPGLVGRAQFNGLEHGHTFAHSIALMVMDGRLRAISAGFQAQDVTRFEEGTKEAPVIGWEPKRQVLLEASPCVIGMDPDALAHVERTAAEAIEDPRERERFVQHVRSIAGRGQVTGVPLASAPEIVRSILDAPHEDDVEQDDGWIEPGFRWDDSPIEVRSVPNEPAEEVADELEPEAEEPAVDPIAERLAALEAEIEKIRAERSGPTEPEPTELAPDLTTDNTPTHAADIAALEGRLMERLDEVVTDLSALIDTNRTKPVEPVADQSPAAGKGEGTDGAVHRELAEALRRQAEDHARTIETVLRKMTGHVGRKG